MKTHVFLFALLCCCQLAFAQYPSGGPSNGGRPAGNPGAPTAPASAPRGNGRINGTVLDSASRQPVSFATVALNDPATGKAVDGTVCDDKGKFTLTKLPVGTWDLAISFIGYKTFAKSSVVVAEKGTDIDLGTIVIASIAKQLKEVVVEGQRALIEEKVDRTVYNAENDQTTKGGDATDVLKRVPMLSVDLDGNVTMRGSQNIRVLINNRPSTIAANSVADALKQIPADQIKSVEVITSPSAKYDAEGSAGIINIITKKNTLQGATLNIDGSAGLRGSNLGLNGSYRKGKMGFSLGGFGRAGYNVRGSFENSQLTQRFDSSSMAYVPSLTLQQADTRNSYAFGNYQLGWDYDINKKNFITASLRYGLRNGNTYQDHLLSQTFMNNSLANSNVRDVNVSDLSGTVDLSLNYTYSFDKPQREFSILTLYSRNNRTNDFFNNILNGNDFSVLSRIKNENESFNQEVTVQADYQTPIGKTQMLELGGKNIMREVSSDYATLESAGADGAFTPAKGQNLSNVFNYNQNVTAAYFSYTLSFLKNYSLKAGTRYEYTTINANFQSDQKVEIPSYGVMVPSLNLSRKLKNGNTLKAAYNRRIQRPSLQFLNPNRQASNPLNVTIGNPDLRPEYTNNYELSYSTYFKNTSLNFSSFMRNTNNSIQSVRDVLGRDTIRTTYQNIGKEDAYGLSVFVNINVSNKFSLNGGTDVYYAVLNNNVPNEIYNAHNEGWVVSGRIFGNYTIAKGWGVQAFTFYRGRQVQLQGVQGGFGIYSLSLKKDFNNKKGSIGFGAENFFTPKFRIRNELISPVITQNSTTVMRTMNFKVNFSYRIGKMTMDNTPRKRRKSINNDDLKDGGGSDNGGGGGGAPAGGGGSAPAGAPAGGGQRPAQTPGAGAPGSTAPGTAPTQNRTPGSAMPGQTPATAPVQKTDSTVVPAPGTVPVQKTDSTSAPAQSPVPSQSTPAPTPVTPVPGSTTPAPAQKP